ncbi:GNAT family N-acetyltransferase [Streptomyces sp. NPDC001933]|uniref:GNAT family N-acetyltransferase n=1 Tax=Streptomyces sp. NPDC001933 TaxID=3364626 RepID=UPI0036ABA6BA
MCIRTARATDTDAFIGLTSFIDLHVPESEVPSKFDALRDALAIDPCGPLSHGFNHFLIAEKSDGTPVGAIACGTPLWIFNHPKIPPFMQGMLLRRISCVQTLAVHPDHRGQGIGTSLLRAAEATFTQCDYTVLTLRHERGLEDFYGPCGYTSANRLVIDLPPLGPVSVRDRGWSFAVKPLSSQVSFTDVYGYPVRVVTGALTPA